MILLWTQKERVPFPYKATVYTFDRPTGCPSNSSDRRCRIPCHLYSISLIILLHPGEREQCQTNHAPQAVASQVCLGRDAGLRVACRAFLPVHRGADGSCLHLSRHGNIRTSFEGGRCNGVVVADMSSWILVGFMGENDHMFTKYGAICVAQLLASR